MGANSGPIALIFSFFDNLIRRRKRQAAIAKAIDAALLGKKIYIGRMRETIIVYSSDDKINNFSIPHFPLYEETICFIKVNPRTKPLFSIKAYSSSGGGAIEIPIDELVSFIKTSKVIR